MVSMSLRTDSQKEASRANGARSAGPVSTEGKERASLNRAAHGLTGFALVLPGETVARYRHNQERWAEAMGPATGPEAQLVAQLADLAWRLDRCARLEHQRHLAAVEEALAKKTEFVEFSLVKRALLPINLLVSYGESTLARTNLGALGHLAAAARSTVSIVRDVESLPEAWVTELDEAVEDFVVAAHRDRAKREHLLAVVGKARRIQGALVEKAMAAERQLENLRADLAKTTIPTDGDSKKLSRYRADLERSQARLLGVLQQVREQIDVAQNRGPTTLPPLRLRVVK